MTFYELLGIEPTATPDQIHTAYLQLARKHHPDLQGGAESEDFRAIKHAHDVLMNPEFRMIYDESGLDPEDAANKIDLMAIALLRDFTIQILNDDSEATHNILQRLLNMLERDKRQHEISIVRIDRNIEKILKSRESIEAKWTGADRVKKALMMMLDGTADAQRSEAAGVRKQLEPVTRASELLNGATWQWSAEDRAARGQSPQGQGAWVPGRRLSWDGLQR